jgi:23S rRNA (uridine2552-2'-O)-methyltransferase
VERALTAWRKEQSRDRFFRQAKRDDYRARSAYKLIELNERFKLFKRGDAVLDLGAAPGSWSQVAAKAGARVVAVDLSEIEPIAGVTVLRGDITDPLMLLELRAALGRPADAVLSDVSPPISGNRLADHARSIELADASLEVARELARPGSRFVVKVFRGEELDGFVGRVTQTYGQARLAVPEATRAESREAYVVGLGLL